MTTPENSAAETEEPFVDEFADQPQEPPVENVPEKLCDDDSREALDWLTKFLGEDVFFVPCKVGTKVPICKYAERPFGSTKTKGYKALFSGTNIAVKLGEASGGLCSIDFDKAFLYDEFIKVNPQMAKSFTTKSARGFNIWLRMKGDYPGSTKTPHVEWRANKNLTTVWGWHKEEGVRYTVQVMEKPLEMAFTDILWPNTWRVPGEASPVEYLTETVGPMFTIGKAAKLNQRFLAKLYPYEYRVLHDNGLNRFYQYNDETGCWEVLADHDVEVALGDFTGEKLGNVEECNEEAAAVIEKLQLSIDAAFMASCRRILKGEVNCDAFGERQRIVHCANGVVDMTSMPPVFKEFSAEFYSRNACSIRYEPSAKCPRFENELLAPQLDEDDRFMLQLWFGQALLGTNASQTMMLMTGIGGTGKSTIARILSAIIGERNIYELRTEQLQGRFELSFYADKSLLYGGDVNSETLNNSSAHMLKALTGGDSLSGEVKGKSMAHRIKGNFNVLLNSNSRLRLKLSGDASAWSRRLLLLNFDKAGPEKRIRDFDKVLIESEGAGILNWAIEGAKRLLAALDTDGKFPLTDAQRARVENMVQESDSVRSFIQAGVQRSPLPTDVVTTDALFRHYTTFCDGKAWDSRPRGQFVRQAKDLMVEMHRSHWQRNVRAKDSEGSVRDMDGWAGVNLVTLDNVNNSTTGDYHGGYQN